MIIAEKEMALIVANLKGCCGKASKAEMTTIAKSHEHLREIVMMLKNGAGCWCEVIDDISQKHESLCREIQRRMR